MFNGRVTDIGTYAQAGIGSTFLGNIAGAASAINLSGAGSCIIGRVTGDVTGTGIGSLSAGNFETGGSASGCSGAGGHVFGNATTGGVIRSQNVGCGARGTAVGSNAVIEASTDGAWASGFAATRGYLGANAGGTHVLGYATCSGSGTGRAIFFPNALGAFIAGNFTATNAAADKLLNITGVGAVFLGHSLDWLTYAHSGTGSAFIGRAGSAGNTTATISITGSGAFVSGVHEGQVNATADGAAIVGAKSTSGTNIITASGVGSLAGGSASTTATITAGGVASYVRADVSGAGLATATGIGSYVGGRQSGAGSIAASGDGAFVHAHSQVAGGTSSGASAGGTASHIFAYILSAAGAISVNTGGGAQGAMALGRFAASGTSTNYQINSSANGSMISGYFFNTLGSKSVNVTGAGAHLLGRILDFNTHSQSGDGSFFTGTFGKSAVATSVLSIGLSCFVSGHHEGIVTATGTGAGIIGAFSEANGTNTISVTGIASLAGGYIFGTGTSTIAATGIASHARGYVLNTGSQIIAAGDGSFAMGFASASWDILANGTGSLAGGYVDSADCLSTGLAAFAWGDGNRSVADYATTFGFNNDNGSYSCLVGGRYADAATGFTAASWIATDPMFVLGNGASAGSRANAFAVLKNGNMQMLNNTEIQVRDAANSAWLTVVNLDGSDVFRLGTFSGSTNIVLQSNTLVALSCLTGPIQLTAGTFADYANVPYNKDFVWESGNTAARPSGVLGKVYFDTDLSTTGLPIWFDGTNWIDAAGNVV
jgi:hypothetical protein